MKATRTLSPLVVFVLFFIGIQWLDGAWKSEVGSHPDEAAHYVTGLMVHDYVISGMKSSPLRFAQSYYDHYPKVGLGVWPPVFYTIQTVWTLPFSSSLPSVIVLMAFLAGSVTFLLFRSLNEEFGEFVAWAGALLFACLPLVEQYASMVMAETLSTLLMFAATLYLGRFLDSKKLRDAVGFGLCAALAILTKGTGMALVLTAALAIIIARQWHLLLNRGLWVAGALVALIAGPWTWIFRNQGRGGWEESSPSWHFTSHAVIYYPRKLLITAGILVILFALIGLVAAWCKRSRAGSGKWIACASLILAILIFQTIMPVGYEARHLLPAMPAVVLFAMGGCVALARKVERVFPGNHQAFFGAGLLAAFLGAGALTPKRQSGFGSAGEFIDVSPFRISRKAFIGFGSAADSTLKESFRPTCLVASDARGEGMFIAEMAMRDPHRPSFKIARATKMLAASTWSGAGYQSYFETPEKVTAMIHEIGADFVVLDNSVPKLLPHQQLLRTALEQSPASFALAGKFPIQRDGVLQPDAIMLYKVRHE